MFPIYIIEHDEVKATSALNQHRGSTAPATTPAPSSSAIVASNHVSAAHVSLSLNQYAAMESDSEDDFQDMGVSS